MAGDGAEVKDIGGRTGQTLNRLPWEIIEEIASYLQLWDIESLRLTSRDVKFGCQRPWMKECFSIRHCVLADEYHLNRFLTATKNEQYCKFIQEIDFFVDEIRDDQPPSSTNTNKPALQVKQDEMRTSDRDLKILTEIFTNLRRSDVSPKIRLMESEEPHRRSRRYMQIRAEIYGDQDRPRIMIRPPSVTDARPIRIVLQAIASSSLKVLDLTCCCLDWRFDIDVLIGETIPESQIMLQNAFNGLVSLKIEAQFNKAAPAEAFATALSKAPNFQSLYWGVSNSTGAVDDPLSDALFSKTYPALQKVHLTDAKVAISLLIGFVERHPLLRKLTLEPVQYTELRRFPELDTLLNERNIISDDPSFWM